MTVYIDHNGKCDVEWVDGKPTWKRAIQKHGMANVCGNCFERIEAPLLPFPGTTLKNAKPDLDDV